MAALMFAYNTGLVSMTPVNINTVQVVAEVVQVRLVVCEWSLEFTWGSLKASSFGI